MRRLYRWLAGVPRAAAVPTIEPAVPSYIRSLTDPYKLTHAWWEMVWEERRWNLRGSHDQPWAALISPCPAFIISRSQHQLVS